MSTVSGASGVQSMMRSLICPLGWKVFCSSIFCLLPSRFTETSRVTGNTLLRYLSRSRPMKLQTMRSSLAQRHQYGSNPSRPLGASTGTAAAALVRSFTATKFCPSAVTIMASDRPFGEIDTDLTCAPEKNASSGGGAAAAAMQNASNDRRGRDAAQWIHAPHTHPCI